MKLLLALAFVLGMSLPGQANAQESRRHERFAAGHILAKPRDAVNNVEFDAVVGKHGGQTRGTLRAARLHVIAVTPGEEEETVQVLALDPRIEFAELDRLLEPETTTANDPHYSSAWHLAMIGAPTAWDIAKGSGVIVAILDSGVDGTHPDLAGKLVAGWNLVDDNDDTSDVYGHGTHVAGVVGAASNNSLGVTSIAWQTQLMPVRVTQTSGSAYISTIANGIIWAADHGAQIANASFATLTDSRTFQEAANYMRDKDGLVVVAAGNSGTLDTTADSPFAISVASTTSSDARASWSSYGTYIDVAAPGSGLWTTTVGGGYASVSGSSFSGPLTAGVLALMKSANRSLSNTVLESILKNTATDLGTPGYDQFYGHGRINAAAAVAAAANFAVGNDTQPPTIRISTPTGGTASSTVAVTTLASDNVGVTRVELYVDARLVGTSTTEPHTFLWDTRNATDGVISLQAYAYDKTGNAGASTIVTVTVVNGSASTSSPNVKSSNQESGVSGGGGGGGGGVDILSVIGLLLARLITGYRRDSLRR